MIVRTRQVHRAYVGIGSNLGDRLGYLRQAVAQLADCAVSLRVADVYESDPVDYLDQPDFLNTVAEVGTQLSPLPLLARLQAIEQSLGRERTVRFGPRTVDLDILLFDDEYICFRSLQIPHPRLWQRAFALLPLAGLAPHKRGLGGRTLCELAAEAEGRGIRHVGRLWQETAGVPQTQAIDTSTTG